MRSAVIAVDGPSGSGKSTTARGVARRLGLRYLDTGAMYRAATWWVLHNGVDVTDPESVAAVIGKPDIAVGTDPARPTVHVDGVDVAKPIRSRPVSNAVSTVSAVPEVRRRMVAMQREVIADGGIVVEGRDIGTVVAPDAPVKVFLTAHPDARAQRRTRDRAAERGVPLDVTHTELTRRDRLDSTRPTSPLTKAADAIEIDSTALTLNEVIDTVVALVRERVGQP